MRVKYPAMMLAAVLVAAQGCFLHKSKASAPAEAAVAQASPEATPAPQNAGARIQIVYTHKGDYLRSLTVTKFFGATEIAGHARSQGQVAVVRFEGGEPVWQIKAAPGIGSLLSHLPGVNEDHKFAVGTVAYGVLPKNFVKVQPAQGDPEPLEPGRYYIFEAKRAVGDTSYEAIHVAPDGTIEGFAAQPLIGTSYELCCSVPPDFASPAPSPGDSTPDSGGDTGAP